MTDSEALASIADALKRIADMLEKELARQASERDPRNIGARATRP